MDGVLQINWSRSKAKPVASIGPDGWVSDDPRLMTALESEYKPPSTEAGTPFVIAFWRAVEGLNADVLQEPSPDEEYPG
jgi:hypothetical protein